MKYIHLILVALVIGAIVALSPLYAPLVQQALNPETPVQVEQPPQEHYVPVNITMMDESGEICINNSALGSYLSTLPAGTLTDEEKEGILYMREEEKLARDVYLTLYEKWGLHIFANIARSEQTHMDAVKLLIKRYGLEDPAMDEIGKFTNPTLQELYNQLVEMGSKSIIDALKVGAMIEEIDIMDLKKYIAETNKDDIKIVYENLMMGSRNHLRAFVRVMENYGYTYQPQYLSLEEYYQIISTPMETGAGMGGIGPGTGGNGHRHGHGGGGY